MKIPRVSIGLLMGIVVAFAVNLAVLHQLGPLVDSDNPLALVIFSTIVMANSLLIGAYRVEAGGGPFVEGFVLALPSSFLIGVPHPLWRKYRH